MSQPNNLRRCHTTLDQDSSLIAVVEMSQSSWLAACVVPGISRQERSMADAMYAPVVTRFLTYHVKLDDICGAYCRTIMAMPEMIEWIDPAKQEPENVEELEVEF